MVDGNFCEKADGLKQGSITVMSLSRRLYLYIRDPCLDRDSKQSDERVTDNMLLYRPGASSKIHSVEIVLRGQRKGGRRVSPGTPRTRWLQSDPRSKTLNFKLPSSFPL